MNEYNIEMRTEAHDGYYNESVTTIENIEIQNLNGDGSLIRFGTGLSK
jgi:hypothetical protein